MAQEQKPYHRTTMKTDTRLSIKEKRSKLVRSMTPKKFCEGLVEVVKDRALLKSYQIKILDKILNKSLSGHYADIKDYEALIDMQGTIKVYKVNNYVNSGARLNRLRRLPVTRDNNNKEI
jgi:hypothetical protein